MRIFLLIIFFFGTLNFAFSQKYSLKIVCAENENLSYKKKFKDSLSVISELEFILKKYQNKGYFSASFDSLKSENKQINAYFSLGEKYLLSEINFSNLDDYEQKEIGIKPQKLKNNAYNHSKIEKIYAKIIQHYENSGYPFVQVLVDSTIFYENQISVFSRIEKGDFFRVDSIILVGNSQISRKYIQKKIEIKQNDFYNEQKIREIDQKIENIDFLQISQPSQVEFHWQSADLYIYLKKRKANRFSGVAGFLPKQNSNQVLLTGELDLELHNSLKKGELMRLKWQRLKVASQKIDLELNYPYILGTDFGLTEKFWLAKEDSTYIQVNNVLGVQYFLSGNFFVEANINSFLSVVIAENLPENSNFQNIRTNLYGTGFGFQNIDYKHNPRSGLQISAYTALGNKQVSDSLKSLQIEILANLEYFIPLKNKLVFRHKILGATKQNEQGLYENELYKIGGMQTIRGFDDESIYASVFAINAFEIRYLFERKSNVFLFYEIGYYQKKVVGNFVKDIPQSFGAGVNFSTQAGIFSLSYALGKQFDNPFLINSAKIHFGFVSLF